MSNDKKHFGKDGHAAWLWPTSKTGINSIIKKGNLEHVHSVRRSTNHCQHFHWLCLYMYHLAPALSPSSSLPLSSKCSVYVASEHAYLLSTDFQLSFASSHMHLNAYHSPTTSISSFLETWTYLFFLPCALPFPIPLPHPSLAAISIPPLFVHLSLFHLPSPSILLPALLFFPTY